MQVKTHIQTNITKGREDETFFSYRKDLKKIKNSPCSNSNIQKNRSYLCHGNITSLGYP